MVTSILPSETSECVLKLCIGTADADVADGIFSHLAGARARLRISIYTRASIYTSRACT